jgi:hypothetical protein
MYGDDVERILVGINLVKDTTTESINLLSEAVAYRIISDAVHGGTSTAPCHPVETEVPVSSYKFISPIRKAMDSIKEDYIKMNELAEGLYINISKFNNKYGSPWTELNKLEESIKDAEAFASKHSILNWVGEKSGLLGLLNKILTLSIDSKWTLVYYHDYIQRGYDNQYNNNDPTIRFTSGIEKQSIGTVKHEYSENVRIKEKSIDPF